MNGQFQGNLRSMLVLSRRVGEKLLIGDDIVITVIDTRGDGVRLGIEAPVPPASTGQKSSKRSPHPTSPQPSAQRKQMTHATNFSRP